MLLEMSFKKVTFHLLIRLLLSHQCFLPSVVLEVDQLCEDHELIYNNVLDYNYLCSY
jgi:hypothetical protein